MLLNSEITVCHITTLHQRYDVRIFLKECSAVSTVYRTFLIVADGKGDEHVNGIHIVDAGRREGSIIQRFLKTTSRVYRKALSLNCSVYHFHDPEFIFYGYKLSRKGKKVIYDAHEDLPRQILRKPYISVVFRPLISKIAESIENLFAKRFDAIVTSTPDIRSRFLSVNPRSVEICNYVIPEEFAAIRSFKERQNSICYIGGITEVRGIREILLAMNEIDPDVRLELAGKFEENHFEDELHLMSCWSRVRYHGYVGRKEITEILQASGIGMLTLHPAPGYMSSLPVKLFEYMAAGVPVIASDFPLWKEIIEGNNCGICVNPFDPSEIARAVTFLFQNPDIADAMGENGHRTVMLKYSWHSEKKKLFELYNSLN